MKNARKVGCCLISLVVTLLIASWSAAQTLPSPPAQPRFGPGGSAYLHARARITESAAITSRGRVAYMTYEPDLPRPSSAPVFVFISGANPTGLPLSINYLIYSGLLNHLARKGYLVIYLDDIASNSTVLASINEADEVLAEVIRYALAQQRLPGRVSPARDDYGTRLAMGGHSLGGIFTQIIANQAVQFNLPQARALLLIDSTDRGIISPNPSNPLDAGNLALPPEWRDIPSATRVLHFRTGDSMHQPYGLATLTFCPKYVWADAEIRRMFVNVPNENYSYAYLQRDDYGRPALESNHFSVLGSPSLILNGLGDILAAAIAPQLFGPFENALNGMFTVDAVDYYGIWRRSEAMLNLTLKKVNKEEEFAFDINGGEKFRDMGVWSDGMPVKAVLSQNDFPDWFDITAPFSPMPQAPNGLFITGAPAITFPKTRVNAISSKQALLASFGPDEPVILSMEIRGTNASSFRLPNTAAPALATAFFIEFAPRRSSGPQSATLAVRYSIGGVEQTATRNLRGEALPILQDLPVR